MERASFDQVFFGEFDEVFYGRDRRLRFAVESPVKYEVWLAYAQEPDPAPPRVGLILESHEDVEPKEVARGLIGALEQAEFDVPEARVAVTGDFVAADLEFDEMVTCVIPSTPLRDVLEHARDMPVPALEALIRNDRSQIDGYLHSKALKRLKQSKDELIWFVRLLAAVNERAEPGQDIDVEPAVERIRQILQRAVLQESPPARLLWQQQKYVSDKPPPADRGEPGEIRIGRVTRNRDAWVAVNTSRRTVKADAAHRLFEASCKDIAWAVVDSGIDARHPAFQETPGSPNPGEASSSRIVATYDFTRIRNALAIATEDDLENRANAGGEVRWTDIVQQHIQIEHDENYVAPVSDHGTHVAGILGGNWRDPGSGRELQGICPDIRLYDFRAFDQEGNGKEFEIVAALQFIRWINERARRTVIAGVNLSFSIPHDVANYSCGWTPVCVEADRLVRSGVVVVAAAGNSGYLGTAYAKGTEYHTISITDPGNAERVITVGSTHRTNPHRHGVSFFSGRGPTADGRVKPDVVAPGEEIDGPVPEGEIRTMDGTSQAAPHVSGAAALLMARYRELIGRPERVKELLMSTASDLSRERTFQGAGLVDTLRAMQAM